LLTEKKKREIQDQEINLQTENGLFKDLQNSRIVLCDKSID